jgi:hypothetical protein
MLVRRPTALALLDWLRYVAFWWTAWVIRSGSRSQEALAMAIDFTGLKQRVLETARQCARRGAGYSQQRPVLDEVASAVGGNMYMRLDLELQQAILTCWHDLFREGTLSWGYDLDNPDPPFFHIPNRADPREQPRRRGKRLEA